MQTAADWMGKPRSAPHEGAGDALSATGQSPASRVDRWALAQIATSLADPAIRLDLWDGTAVGPPQSEAAVAVHIADRRTLYALVVDTEVAFGDGYSDGRIEVGGN